MSNRYSVGQMNQLGDRFEAADFSPDELTKLGSYTKLVDLKKLFTGCAEIVITKHVIDCDAAPFIPNGWSLEEHQKGGQVEWNSDSITLYLSEVQKNGRIVGNDLRKELAGKPVLNANVLDYLLAHPHLIPEEWKGKAIFFWGTVYRFGYGNLYVRYLYWNVGRWNWHSNWLDYSWNANDPAVLLASIS